MGDTPKIRKIAIDITKLLPAVFIKEITENEEICETCGGLGIVLEDFNYKLGEDGEKRFPHLNLNNGKQLQGKMFMYNNKYLSMCPDCCVGVRYKCKYCGQPIQRGFTKRCDCKGYLKEEELKRAAEENKRILNSERVDYENLNEIKMLYDESNNQFIKADELDEYLEALLFDHQDEPDFELPSWLWATETKDIELSAKEILSNACEDLHEDAFESIPEEEIKELQEDLDNWNMLQTGNTKTYFPDYTRRVFFEDLAEEIKGEKNNG